MSAEPSSSASLPGSRSVESRVELDGKFFRAGSERFHVRGVSYGAFAPNNAGEPFPEPERAARDLDLMVELGANTVRVYDVPPHWLIDAAAARGLRLFVTVPWTVQSCFLNSRNSRREIRTAVTSAVQAVGRHPAVFAIALANEIPPDIVRWNGTDRTAAFLDELARAGRDAAPECLFTYSNYPPTEFLRPQRLDFITFNVFLHSRDALARYLAHLHLAAESQPLLLGECGIDSRHEGLERQAEILSWTLETTRERGLAGAIVFSFTDDWFRNEAPVTEWEMGLCTRERAPKPAFAAVQAAFRAPQPPPPPALPKVTVVVATYNGARTLADCLDSLLRLRYPRCEIVVVDDGSTDDTTDVLARYPQVRALRLRENLGLSNARNLGIRSATGEIIAFTDADCRVDPDWLHYVVAGLHQAPLAGIGGPNFLPPDDSPVAAVVMAAPGGPAHVLLDDQVAEHLPGCNMAFWKWALDAIGGFDPQFHQAGDDVDVCWRLQRMGWQLGFTPAGFVWHHRRSSLRAYLRQQSGYGHAEALLWAKHPAHFNRIGAARWQGRICTTAQVNLPGRRASIYRGAFATGMFQTLYGPESDGLMALLTSLEYHALVVLPPFVLAFFFPWLWPLTALVAAVPLALCCLAAGVSTLPRGRTRAWSRPLLALLYLLQPIVRGAARYAGRLGLEAGQTTSGRSLEAQSRVYAAERVDERAYWSATWKDRHEWVARMMTALEEQDWACRPDSGWGTYDLDIPGSRWSRIALVTAAESTRGGGQTLRCRLDRRWTFAAYVLWWGTLVMLMIIAGLFDVNWRGLWVPVVTLGGIAWFLRHQGRVLQCRLTVVLDEVARDWGLTPLPQRG